MRDLENRGLITRMTDEADARRTIVAITDRGSDLLRRRDQDAREHLLEALRTEFSEPELSQFADVIPLLRRLADAL